MACGAISESFAVLEHAAFGRNRHCEERSDEAIQRTRAPYVPLDCFPPGPKAQGVAMTITVRPKYNLLYPDLPAVLKNNTKSEPAWQEIVGFFLPSETPSG